MSFVSIVFGFLTGALQAINKYLDFYKSKKLIDQGRDLQKAEDIEKELKINDKQNDILMEERTREDTIKKLENGTF